MQASSEISKEIVVTRCKVTIKGDDQKSIKIFKLFLLLSRSRTIYNLSILHRWFWMSRCHLESVQQTCKVMVVPGSIKSIISTSFWSQNTVDTIFLRLDLIEFFQLRCTRTTSLHRSFRFSIDVRNSSFITSDNMGKKFIFFLVKAVEKSTCMISVFSTAIVCTISDSLQFQSWF